ncbi:hypothetical protein Tco_0366239 [Tanacetum coccineum]
MTWQSHFIIKASYWSRPQRGDYGLRKESTREGNFHTRSTLKRNTIKPDTRMPRWQSVCPIYDPRAKKTLPMIEFPLWHQWRPTGIKRYIDPISGHKIKRTNRRCRIPIDSYPCEVIESMTMKKVGDQTIGVIRRRRIDKEGNVSRFQGYHTSDEEEEELSGHPPYKKYGFVDHPQLQRN